MTTYLASVLASRNTKLPTFPSDLPPSSPSFLALLVFLSFYTASLRACLHGGGRPQMGEETCGGLPHLSCNRDQIKMRDYRNGWVTLPKRVSSPTWGPPPPCNQAQTCSCVLQDFYDFFFECKVADSSCSQ